MERSELRVKISWLEGEIERCDRIQEDLFTHLEKKEQELGRVPFWHERGLRDELNAIVSRIDDWRSYEYKLREDLEVEKQRQSLMVAIEVAVLKARREAELENKREAELRAKREAEMEAELLTEVQEKVRAEAEKRKLQQQGVEELLAKDRVLQAIPYLFVVEPYNNGYEWLSRELVTLFKEVIMHMEVKLAYEGVLEVAEVVFETKPEEIEQEYQLIFIEADKVTAHNPLEVNLIQFVLCTSKLAMQNYEAIVWPTGIGVGVSYYELLWYEDMRYDLEHLIMKRVVKFWVYNLVDELFCGVVERKHADTKGLMFMWNEATITREEVMNFDGASIVGKLLYLFFMTIKWEVHSITLQFSDVPSFYLWESCNIDAELWDLSNTLILSRSNVFEKMEVDARVLADDTTLTRGLIVEGVKVITYGSNLVQIARGNAMIFGWFFVVGVYVGFAFARHNALSVSKMEAGFAENRWWLWLPKVKKWVVNLVKGRGNEAVIASHTCLNGIANSGTGSLYLVEVWNESDGKYKPRKFSGLLKMVAFGGSCYPTLASAMTPLQRCAFSDSLEMHMIIALALATLTIKSGEPFKLQISEFLHTLAQDGVLQRSWSYFEFLRSYSSLSKEVRVDQFYQRLLLESESSGGEKDGRNEKQIGTVLVLCSHELVRYGDGDSKMELSLGVLVRCSKCEKIQYGNVQGKWDPGIKHYSSLDFKILRVVRFSKGMVIREKNGYRNYSHEVKVDFEGTGNYIWDSWDIERKLDEVMQVSVFKLKELKEAMRVTYKREVRGNFGWCTSFVEYLRGTRVVSEEMLIAEGINRRECIYLQSCNTVVMVRDAQVYLAGSIVKHASETKQQHMKFELVKRWLSLDSCVKFHTKAYWLKPFSSPVHDTWPSALAATVQGRKASENSNEVRPVATRALYNTQRSSQIFHWMEEHGNSQNSNTLKTILEASFSMANYEKAMSLFSTTLEVASCPTVLTYNTLIKEYLLSYVCSKMRELEWASRNSVEMVKLVDETDNIQLREEYGERLKQDAFKAKSPFYRSCVKPEPIKIAAEGMRKFKNGNCELIIVDTSGRHKHEATLFEEMGQVSEATKLVLVILVRNSNLEQAAFDQSQAFRQGVAIGSIIITKRDDHAEENGAPIAVAVTQCHIILVGTGEHWDEKDSGEAADGVYSKCKEDLRTSLFEGGSIVRISCVDGPTSKQIGLKSISPVASLQPKEGNGIVSERGEHACFVRMMRRRRKRTKRSSWVQSITIHKRTAQAREGTIVAAGGICIVVVCCFRVNENVVGEADLGAR